MVHIKKFLKKLTPKKRITIYICVCVYTHTHTHTHTHYIHTYSFPGGSVVKNPPAVQETKETCVLFLGREAPLEKEMAAHPGILAWEIPWTEEPGRLQCMGLQRVRHNLVTKQPPQHTYICIHIYI